MNLTRPSSCHLARFVVREEVCTQPIKLERWHVGAHHHALVQDTVRDNVDFPKDEHGKPKLEGHSGFDVAVRRRESIVTDHMILPIVILDVDGLIDLAVGHESPPERN